MASKDSEVLKLQSTIQTFPVIDNHAHNLLRSHQLDTHPFESITTEAQGAALKDTFATLSHLRAQKQLRRLYGCSHDADWDNILEKRQHWLREDPKGLIRKCFESIHSILMDDGLATVDVVHEYEWHDQFTPGRTGRIVRIEAAAEHIMRHVLAKYSDIHHGVPLDENAAWISFSRNFEKLLKGYIADPAVVGFKSVVCYRSSLDIQPTDLRARAMRLEFEDYCARALGKGMYRLDYKTLNDAILQTTVSSLSDGLEKPAMSKPLQLHTGLGDKDINLVKSNPAYLQPLIAQHPRVPFVLLHSSYPYTREAGYLTAMYKNAFLDLGEVFPQLSRDGQVSVLRKSLELCPTNKLLYSSDGHFFPETYWLGLVQFREVMEQVILEYVEKKDITTDQATAIVENIYFHNSNELYNLRVNLDDLSEKTEAEPLRLLPVKYDANSFEHFMHKNDTVEYIYVQWVTLMGVLRTRILPVAEFTRLIKNGGRIGIAKGNTGTLQNDHVTPVCAPVGQVYVEFDLSSIRRTIPQNPFEAASVFGSWSDEKGHPLDECPRSNLARILHGLAEDFNVNLLIGFEIEVTMLVKTEDTEESRKYKPLATNHAWGSLSPEDYQKALPLLHEIASSLKRIGIELQQFHSESGSGQYEFVLAPLPALQAVDTLYQARQVVDQVASKHNVRATLHPLPFPGIGTAAHAHISLQPAYVEVELPEDVEAKFWIDGVLHHLPAICAFTLPEGVSYGRVTDDNWSGGSWIGWGTQNREMPLRKVETGRWEIRCLDGMANMYLAIAAIAGAGYMGAFEGDRHGARPGDCQCEYIWISFFSFFLPSYLHPYLSHSGKLTHI
ncbi:hypothetical protein M501DRAFT_821685 [Patellaria atrata CBS 101060]|uniref:GS catalytic domain-containing protein n=1 Tax=Patellaria atrata CBS 101060 TaxID=1346257 RepID=A0A9P4S9N7_9PEZI|nr:hypothetical protein M501DRAFT_821685 [Patellaria atrata CBS 101060]